MDASGMNPATAAAFEGMMQQKQVNLTTHSITLYYRAIEGYTRSTRY